jgi:hypothetical protein
MSLTLHELQRRLTAFNIYNEVRETIGETSGDITEFNRNQLFEGKRATGTEIKPEYAEFTILIKDQKGQPTDRVTLKDTGSFYESIFVDVNSETFDIYASDEKTEKLERKYGKTIFGLSKNNRSQYVQYTFFPELKKRIESKLKLKLE